MVKRTLRRMRLGRGAALLVTVAVLEARAAADDAAVGAAAADNRRALEAERGFDLGSLSRLAELEGARGNGGAEETDAAILAGYDAKEGFHIRNKDNTFLLAIKGQIQFRYTYKARDTRGDTRDAGEIGKEDDSFFELERVRIGVQGHLLTPDLTYKILFDGDTDGAGAVRTLDAYIEYWAGKALGADNSELIGIGFGQAKGPFGLQETVSSQDMQMVERSLANEFFNVDRTLGVWVRGLIGPLYYAAAVTNGFDSINVTPAAIDNIPALIARANVDLLGEREAKGKYEESNLKQKESLLIGGSVAYDANNQGSGVGGLDFQVYQFGLEAAFKMGPFSLQSEYFGRWVDYEIGNAAIPGGDGSGNFAHGAYVQSGILVSDNVELTARASAVWADGAQDGNGVEVGPGFNWFISGNHRVKWQTDLLFFDISPDLPDSTEDLDGNSAAGNAGAALGSSFNSSSAALAAGEQGLMLRTQLQISF